MQNYVDLGVFGSNNLARAMSYRSNELPANELPPLTSYTARNGQTYSTINGYGSEFHKYYRLVGIEKKSANEINALYGQKVPNFWDFYNFNNGDEFYSTLTTCDKMSSSPWTPLTFTLKNEKSKILNKQIGSNSITYTIQSSYQYIYLANQGSCGALPGAVTNTTSIVTYSNTNNLFENYLYPGAIFDVLNPNANPVTNTFNTFNVCSFINDTKSKFTKSAGFYCSQNNPALNDTVVAFKYVPTYSVMVPSAYYNSTFGFSPYEQNQKIFTAGLGTVKDECVIFEHSKQYCLISAVLGTDTVLGPMPGWNLGVGLNEYNEVIPMNSLYPNPANDYIMIDSSQSGTIEVYDALGVKLILDGVAQAANAGDEARDVDGGRAHVGAASARAEIEVNVRDGEVHGGLRGCPSS